MNASRLVLAVIAFLSASHLEGQAQGFAGLGTTAEGFTAPKQGAPLEFPRDHGAHPDFRIEWWYVTANLKDGNGQDYGAQWTLFRSALLPQTVQGWSDPQIWLGHAAVTTKDHHYFGERLARGGVGQAGVTPQPFNAWIDEWGMQGTGAPDADPVQNLRIKAQAETFSYDLALSAKGPIVQQGDEGYSVKSASGQASFYYSQPYYDVEGQIVLQGKPVTVTGKAWMDREWSSQPLAADQTGWDWFSLHLASGDKVMAFRLRDGGGGFSSANWVSANGETIPLSGNEVIIEPKQTTSVGDRMIPTGWRVRIPSKNLDVVTRPLNPQSWMGTTTPYWEGPITFEGTTAGEGYLEMTGY